MEKRPLVSVILPVYNGEQYIRQAIESLLDQTYDNLEILVLNDASNDGSMAIVSSIPDRRITIIHNEYNSGIVKTLNKGIDLAKGEYIARMDADDIAMPTRIEKQIDYFLSHPHAAMVDVIMEYINEKGQPLNKYNSTVVDEKKIIRTLAYTNCLGHPSAMVKASIYKAYHYRQIPFEDYDLWLRLINDGEHIFKIPEPLLYYRIHGSSIMVKARFNRRIFLAKTKLFYFKHLNFTDRLKTFNLCILLTGIFNYFHGYLKYSYCQLINNFTPS